MTSLPPGSLLILGALPLFLLRGWGKTIWLLGLPILSLWQLLSWPENLSLTLTAVGLKFDLVVLDQTSLLFAVLFHIAGFFCLIYSLYLKGRTEQMATMIYSGAAIGAVMAGDLVTLFVYWELTALASVILIWSRGSERAIAAGMRYLLIQVSSGLLLFSGIVLLVYQGQAAHYDALDITTLAGQLVFVSFGIKAGFPLLYNWLTDAYPEATETGTVVLSCFTTKLAVYALYRAYSGNDSLIFLGAIMTLMPLIHAAVENDLRRALSYILVAQLGYLVVAVGIGSPLALSGAIAHAYSSVFYQALLFMALGAVLLRTGSTRASDLGGLFTYMPWTAVLCMVGAATLSAVPLTSSFATKSLILTAVAESGHQYVWLVLVCAAGITTCIAGIRIPYLLFAGPNRSTRPRPATTSMQVAMGLVALLCISVGVYPDMLLQYLPATADQHIYNGEHIFTQLQLLAGAGLTFVALHRFARYPLTQRIQLLDYDFSYRILGRAILTTFTRICSWVITLIQKEAIHYLRKGRDSLSFYHGPEGTLARSWPTGSMVVWVTVLLSLYLFINYI